MRGRIALAGIGIASMLCVLIWWTGEVDDASVVGPLASSETSSGSAGPVARILVQSVPAAASPAVERREVVHIPDRGSDPFASVVPGMAGKSRLVASRPQGLASSREHALRSRIEAVLARHGWRGDRALVNRLETWVHERLRSQQALLASFGLGDARKQRMAYRRELSAALSGLRREVGPRLVQDLLMRFPIHDVDPETGILAVVGRRSNRSDPVDD